MNKLLFLVALFFLYSITGCEKDDTIDNILDADAENTTANFVTTSSQFAIGKIVIKTLKTIVKNPTYYKYSSAKELLKEID